MRGDGEQEIGIRSHALKAGFAAQHVPDCFRFHGDLAAPGLKVVARDRAYPIKIERLESGDERFKTAAVQADRRAARVPGRAREACNEEEKPEKRCRSMHSDVR